MKHKIIILLLVTFILPYRFLFSMEKTQFQIYGTFKPQEKTTTYITKHSFRARRRRYPRIVVEHPETRSSRKATCKTKDLFCITASVILCLGSAAVVVYVIAEKCCG